MTRTAHIDLPDGRQLNYEIRLFCQSAEPALENDGAGRPDRNRSQIIKQPAGGGLGTWKA